MSADVPCPMRAEGLCASAAAQHSASNQQEELRCRNTAAESCTQPQEGRARKTVSLGQAIISLLPHHTWLWLQVEQPARLQGA